MERCLICGSPLYPEDGISPYTGSDGKKGAVCGSCKRQMDELKDEKGENKFDAVSKLYPGAKAGNGPGRACAVNPQAELEDVIRKMKGVSPKKEIDYPAHQTGGNYDTGGSFWIAALKVFTWIVFVVTVIAGIVAGIELMAQHKEVYGVLVILGAFIAAFLEAAFFMVIANAAQDIEAIRSILQNRK